MRQELARLSKNTLIYGVGGLINRFIGFLFLPVFTAYLTPTDYGISAILGLVTLATTSVFSLGLGAGVGPCYFEGNRQEQKERTIWTSMVLLTLSAVALVTCGLWVAPQVSRLAFQVPEHAHLLRLTIAAAALNILTIPLMLRLQFEERAGVFVILTAVSSFVSIGATLVLVVGLGRGVLGLVEGGFICQVASLFLYGASTLPRLTLRISRSVATELLRLSLPLVPSFGFVFLLLHGNKYILQWMWGLDSVGVYSIGFNFGLVMGLPVSAFQTAWYPYFMSFLERQEEGRHLFGRISTYYVFAAGGITLLFFVVARPIVALMTQPAFHEAFTTVGLSATAQCCLGAFSLLLPGIYFAREVKYLALVQGAAAIVSAGLNFVLIGIFGILGAAAGLALGMFALAWLQYAWNRRHHYVDIQYEWARIGRFTAIAIPYAVCTFWRPGLSKFAEYALTAGLLGLLPVLMWTLLVREERETLWRGLSSLPGSFSHRLLARSWSVGKHPKWPGSAPS